jgi:hypothetical protein
MSASTIRRPDRVLLLADGRPFFPIEAWQLPAGGTLQDVAAAGFNCVRWRPFGNGHLNSGSGSAAGSDPDVVAMPDSFAPDEAWQLGLRLFVYLYDRCDLDANGKHGDALREVVSRMSTHPATLCWETVNEPAWRPDALDMVSHPAESLAKGYQLVRRLDRRGAHPIFQVSTWWWQLLATTRIVGLLVTCEGPAKNRTHIPNP